MKWRITDDATGALVREGEITQATGAGRGQTYMLVGDTMILAGQTLEYGYDDELSEVLGVGPISMKGPNTPRYFTVARSTDGYDAGGGGGGASLNVVNRWEPFSDYDLETLVCVYDESGFQSGDDLLDEIKADIERRKTLGVWTGDE